MHVGQDKLVPSQEIQVTLHAGERVSSSRWADMTVRP